MKKEVDYTVTICHIQMNRDRINIQGKSADFLSREPERDTHLLHSRIFSFCHRPQGRMPHESEVRVHSRFILNQAQNTP